MEGLLSGIPGVVVYIDDILVTGKTTADHLAALDEVLTRLENAGLHLKRKKCFLMQPSVTYLGHLIDAQGLHPLPDKVRAIQEAPLPRSVAQLKSYLGLLTYYSKFLPNLSSTLSPLYRLLRLSTCWCWTPEAQEAFEASKQLLTSAPLLVHFNSELEITLPHHMALGLCFLTGCQMVRRSQLGMRLAPSLRRNRSTAR